MSEAVIKQIKRLILPNREPVSFAERLEEDGRPAAVEEAAGEAVDERLAEHLSAQKNLAVGLSWLDEEDEDLVKCGVLDVAEGDPSLSTASSLAALAKSRGLSAAAAVNGENQGRVFIFSEALPRAVMAEALEGLRRLLPFKGTVTPNSEAFIHITPGWDRSSRSWTFFFRPGVSSLRPKTRKAPDKGFLAVQAALLAEIRPSDASAVEEAAQAGRDVPGIKAEEADLIPDLSKREGRAPPCIEAMLKQGGSPVLGLYGRHNLLLARYCQSADLTRDKAVKLAEYLADHASPNIGGERDRAERLRHWDLVRKTAAAADYPFSCRYMLLARPDLGFACEVCKVRPPGVPAAGESGWAGQATALETDGPWRLEERLADALLTLAINEAPPARPIDPEVFPPSPTRYGDQETWLPVRGALWRALSAGEDTPAGIVGFIDQRAPAAGLSLTESRLLKEKTLALFHRLKAQEPPQGADKSALVARAADLSLRLGLGRALDRARDRLARADADPAAIVADLEARLSGLDADREDHAGPLTDYAEQLKADLTRRPPAVPAPFAADALTGGLAAGALHVIQAPSRRVKTAVAGQMADHAATLGFPTLLVSPILGRGTWFVLSLCRLAGLTRGQVEGAGESSEAVSQAAEQYLQQTAPRLTARQADGRLGWPDLYQWARAAARRGDNAPPLVVLPDPQWLTNAPNAAAQVMRLTRDAGAAVLLATDPASRLTGPPPQPPARTMTLFASTSAAPDPWAKLENPPRPPDKTDPARPQPLRLDAEDPLSAVSRPLVFEQAHFRLRDA